MLSSAEEGSKSPGLGQGLGGLGMGRQEVGKVGRGEGWGGHARPEHVLREG